ncbi:MAG: helix-turn-helix domain-containing protein [Pseudomonadota bacterium]
MSLETEASLTRGRVAALTGCNSETIRYYERVGLLPEPQRGSNGYRRYSQDQVSRLHFINRAKQLGFSNEDIAELLNIARGPDPHTRAEVKALTDNHIRSIRQRIAELSKMEATLSHIATQCDGADAEVDHCPILLSLFDTTPTSPKCKTL